MSYVPLLNPKAILFAGTNNEPTTDSLLVWDNTNKFLGVGIATPAGKLDVLNSNSHFVAVRQGSTTGLVSGKHYLDLDYNQTSNYGFLQVQTYGTSARKLLINPSGGGAGVGASTDSSGLLTVFGGNASTFIDITASNTGASNYAGLRLSTDNTGGNARMKMGIFAIGNGDWGIGDMYFSLDPDADFNSVDPVSDARMVISSAGVVKIPNLGGYGCGVVGVDNDGTLSFSYGGGGGGHATGSYYGDGNYGQTISLGFTPTSVKIVAYVSGCASIPVEAYRTDQICCGGYGTFWTYGDGCCCSMVSGVSAPCQGIQFYCANSFDVDNNYIFNGSASLNDYGITYYWEAWA
jgi:hypothetical protein